MYHKYLKEFCSFGKMVVFENEDKRSRSDEVYMKGILEGKLETNCITKI